VTVIVGEYDQSYTTGMAVQKVAFSLPRPLYRTVEQARRRTRQSRSAVMQEALRLWVARDQEAARIRKYVAGYRQRPEAPDEVAGLEAAGLEPWTDLPW
jgi:Arc/MetJ-type ribon-helix-helix transcriptional regulator